MNKKGDLIFCLNIILIYEVQESQLLAKEYARLTGKLLLGDLPRNSEILYCIVVLIWSAVSIRAKKQQLALKYEI